MPTQSEIDVLKSKMQVAESLKNSAYTTMSDWCNVVSKRTYTEGSNRTTCSQKVTVVCGEPIDAICCKSLNYSEATCESDKNTYNAKVLDYDKRTDEYEQAKEDYENAKEGKVEGDIEGLNKEASQIKTGYYVFGALVISIIIASVFVIMKYKKK